MSRLSGIIEKYCFTTLVLLYAILLTFYATLIYYFSYSIKIINNILYVEPILIMTGTVVATILAIFFSISIIVIQHAASNYTASIIDEYKYDYRTWYTFLFFIWNLILILISLNNRTKHHIINMTLITCTFTFLFLIVQFIHIINLINPRTIITLAKNDCIRNIKKIPSKLKSKIKSKKTNDLIEKMIMKDSFYEYYLFHTEKDLFLYSKNKILQIFDVIFKSSYRREIETSTIGLEAVSDISFNYIQIRKNDVTQEDEFLDYIYEKLLALSEIAITNKDLSLIQEIIKSFERIGVFTTSIKSIIVFGGPHHSTNMAIWHINSLGYKAAKIDFEDATLQSISSIQNIGVYSIINTKGDGLASEKIFELSLIGIVKSWVIVRRALNALKELLYTSVLNMINIHAEPTRILEHIDEITNKSINNNINYPAFTSLFPIMPQNSIQKIVWAAVHIKNDEYPKIETRGREEYSKEVISALFEKIGKISMIAGTKRNIMLLLYLLDNFLDMIVYLLKEELITYEENYDDVILNAIDPIKRTYFVLPDFNSMAPDSIVDSLTSIAISALNLNKYSITEKCVNSIYDICTFLIPKDEYGYDAARTAGRICVIGSFSLYKRNLKLVFKTIEMILLFDNNYLINSPNPRDRLHIRYMEGAHNRSISNHVVSSMHQRKYMELYKDITKNIIDKYSLIYEEKRKKEKDLILQDCFNILFNE